MQRYRWKWCKLFVVRTGQGRGRRPSHDNGDEGVGNDVELRQFEDGTREGEHEAATTLGNNDRIDTGAENR